MKNKVFLLSFLIFLFAIALRSFHLNRYLSFHQDQVRDLYYLKEYFDNGKLILLGPKASVGDFYLPPFWYYLMGIAYFFSQSPLAPAFLIAVFGSLTAVFIFLFAKKFLDKKVAFLTGILYAVSPLAIEYSRFAWNPNPIPFFVILTFLFLYEFLYENKKNRFVLSTITANLALQLHYQGLIIFSFYFLILLLSKKLNLKRFIIYLLINFILILPFVIFEFGNSFQNSRGIINFLLNSQVKTSLKLFGIPFFIKFIINNFPSFLAKTIFFKNLILGYFFLFFLLIILARFLLRSRQMGKFDKVFKLTSSFLIFSFIMLYFYKNSLIDFYLLFLIPVIIIYLVINLKIFFHEKLLTWLLFILILANLLKSPAFGHYDKTFIWLQESTKIISRKNNYCIIYSIFPENFIEKKFRYMISLAKNKPVYDYCPHIAVSCDPKIKTVYYICEEAICKIPIKIGKITQINPLDYGIKIYEINL
ncbi:MAG: ArnT family glycosyltransferase [Microgenomates group bacterium]